MIIRAGAVKAEHIEGSSVRDEIRLGDAGGMVDMGANIVILQPGQRSSDRHWHANSDEFLFVLEGEPTIVENDGPHDLKPGDCAVWPRGVANAHKVENRTDAAVKFLVCGSNPQTDTIRYPDTHRTLFHEPPRWKIIADDETVLGEGDTD